MSEPYLILLVEESDNSLGIYDSVDGQEVGRVRLSLWPHEIAISPDGHTAYVSNFGLRDYDLNLGYAGNAISVIDIANRVETHRLYTAADGYPYWGPHGVKVYLTESIFTSMWNVSQGSESGTRTRFLGKILPSYSYLI